MTRGANLWSDTLSPRGPLKFHLIKPPCENDGERVESKSPKGKEFFKWIVSSLFFGGFNRLAEDKCTGSYSDWAPRSLCLNQQSHQTYRLKIQSHVCSAQRRSGQRFSITGRDRVVQKKKLKSWLNNCCASSDQTNARWGVYIPVSNVLCGFFVSEMPSNWFSYCTFLCL